MSDNASVSLSVKLGILGCILVMALLICAHVPPDMDIFLPFHALACSVFPNAHYNSFYEPCNGALDLSFAGLLTWARSYRYVGGLDSLLYYPFYMAWPAWQSAIFFNALWMGVMLRAFVALTGVNGWVALCVFAINFFWMQNYLYDLGPIGFQGAMLFVLPLLVRQILQAPTRQRAMFYNIALGVLAFGAVEIKPIFLYDLPALLILVFVFCRQGQGAKAFAGTLVRRCLPALLLFLCACAMLIFSRNHAGFYYWQLLFEQGAVTQYSVSYWQHLQNLISTYMLNFPNSAAVTYGMQEEWLLAAPADYNQIMITLPFWLVAGGLFRRFYSMPASVQESAFLVRRQQINGLLLAALVTLLLVALSTQTRKSYHVAHSMTLLLGAVALCLDLLHRHSKINLKIIVLLLGASQIFCAAYVTRQTPVPNGAWQRLDALAILNEPQMAKRSLVVNLNWGTYFIDSLYGPPEKLSVSTKGVPGDEELKTLVSMAAALGRHLVFVRRTDLAAASFEELQKKLPDLRRLYPAQGQPSQWEVWAQEPLSAK